MEASDAFAQEIEGDDPFAEDFDAQFGEPPADPGPQPAEAEPPIVNREGERIDAPAEAPQNGAGAPEADPTPPAESAGPTEAAPDPTTPSGGEPDPTPASTEAGATQATQANGDEDPTTPAGSPTSEPAEQEPTTGPSAGAPDSTSETAPEPTGEVEDADEPKETEDKSGRKTKRRYLIFQVDGPGKLSQVSWYEDSKGKLTQRGSGAKRQSVCLARGTDDALKFGYAACGSPTNGIKLVAVAKLHFQPREVKPMPQEPMKQRLQIN